MQPALTLYACYLSTEVTKADLDGDIIVQTFATFSMFLAAMVLFPETQRLAQAELDSVVGPDRLPTIHDKAQLPYVSALLVEVFRWQPVVPTGVTHLAMEEDEYKGYRIPSGAVVIPNPWYAL